jgi:maltose O-acetyltransferase
MQTNVRLYGIKNINVGENTFLGGGVRIVTYDARVSIGKNVLIASDCIILTRNHEYSRVDIPIKMQGYVNKDIVIGDDVWLGYRVVVLPGVTIGKGAVIATNSVVNKNIPEYAVYGGSPAKYIKSRRGDEDIPHM